MKPTGVLMCRPTYFDVIDVKNPFMRPNAESIDRGKAEYQWSTLAAAFAESGLAVHEVAPVEGCEDMVFTANPAFTGVRADGTRVALGSCMRYESRNREVKPTLAALANLAYEIVDLPDGVHFEGGGDAVWHANGREIFLGVGPRTDVRAAEAVAGAFFVDVVPLQLLTERFYHLDTAFCVLDEAIAIAYPGAFLPESYELLKNHFDSVIELDGMEAMNLAANAARAGGSTVIIERGAEKTARVLSDYYNVVSVDTSEFIKSGGSVYCMKQYLF
jgi:N-dimethylarginine dimethylaminohydrolase